MALRLVAAWLFGGWAVLSLLGADPALAQAPLTEATTRLELADFGGAIAVLDRAEASTTGLSRAQVVELYSLRSNAHLALGDEAAMEADLGRLVALDPGHEFGPETRPEIREAFRRLGESAGQPLAVAATTSETAGGVRIDGEVTGDSVGLTRTVRVSARAGSGEWHAGEGRLILPAPRGSRVEYFVEAVGPGGAVLAAEADRSAPRSYEVGGAVGAGPGSDGSLGAEDDEGGGSAVIWIAVIGSVAAAVLIGVMIGLAASGGNETTNPSPPMVYP